MTFGHVVMSSLSCKHETQPDHHTDVCSESEFVISSKQGAVFKILHVFYRLLLEKMGSCISMAKVDGELS